MNDLVKEYKESLKKIRQAIRLIENNESKSDEDQVQSGLLRSMERDLVWSIEWMETGREPQNQRGVERLARYQREIVTDPIILDTFYSGCNSKTKKTFHSIIVLDEILNLLSCSEKEVYVMNKGYLLSYSDIAYMKGVSKGTIQTLLKRAQNKLRLFTC